MLKKPLNIFLLIIAGIIILIYITGYNYLFNGIKLTYLSGKTGPTINDGKDFTSKTISRGNPKPWPIDNNYNKRPLPVALKKHLTDTKTVSFLVIQNGKILQEHYWDGYNKDSPSNSFSMANAITVLLLGKAIEDGRIRTINEPFSDFYKEFSDDQFGKNLTLENLASMQAGINWANDHSNPFSKNAAMYYGFSISDVVFKSQFKQNPGETFDYQSVAPQLLGFAVGRAVQMPLSMYASAKLWKPLGMEQNAQWTTDNLGIEKSFCCIQSTARDFAKIGYLLLNRGKFENIQWINESFVDRMTTPTENSNGAYGMGIWINNDTKIHHYYMRGIDGQYVIMIPDYDMIVVRQGNKDSAERDHKNRPKEVEFYINEAIKLSAKN